MLLNEKSKIETNAELRRKYEMERVNIFLKSIDFPKFMKKINKSSDSGRPN